MSIYVDSQIPYGATQVIRRALSDLQWNEQDGALIGGNDPGSTKPMAVYRLGMNDLADEDILFRAQKVSWRYLSETNGVAAYLDVRNKDGKAKFVSLSRNKNADKLMEAAHIAAKIGINTEENVEARILEIPSLYIGALWLNFQNPIFITYVDAKHIVNATTPSVDVDFLEKLRKAALDPKRDINIPDMLDDFGP